MLRISILTPDSKIPNHAAMKISAFHKAQGDEVMLNMPLWPADKTYASIIFDQTHLPEADVYGGPGYDPKVRLADSIEDFKPDYSLYPNIDYSLGYTYRACHRGCSFCKVGDMCEPVDHRSIWSFHNERFDTICLLNNNTFEDPFWYKTFEEIERAKLKVKDQNGYDARLMSRDRASILARVKWSGQLHVAWDRMKDEEAVLRGLRLLIEAGMRPIMISCYVLVGFDTTEEQDIYRIRTLRRLGVLPFVMPYNKPELVKGRSYAKEFIRRSTRPVLIKAIDWESVSNWQEVANY